MAAFSNKQAIKENRIDNLGSWPVRITEFHLIDEYEFPPSQYTEIFLVRSGQFHHETENGTQAVRTGTAMVHHPSSHHIIKQPEQVRLTRVRFLPEWFAGEFASVLESPDLLSLCLARPWFHIPMEMTLHVFTVRDSRQPLLEAAFELLTQVVQAGRHAEPIARVTLLEIMLILGDEYHVYWRGGNRLIMPEEVKAALELIERVIISGGRTPQKRLLAATGLSQEALSQALQKSINVTLPDYVLRRRLHHAALRLLASGEPADVIRDSLGFNDPNRFEENFEKAFALRPEVYRKKFGAGGSTEPLRKQIV